MNKKIITFVIAAIGLGGIASNAQDTACKDGCAQANAEQQIDNKMYKPQKFTDFAFEGILLDINQQAAIDQINQQYQQQLNPRCHGPKQKCDSAQCDKKACPADKKACPADKKACPADNKACPVAGNKVGNCNRGPRDSSWRRQYAAQVKEVLTPDQYVTFLENIAFNIPSRPAMSKDCPNKKLDKDARRHHHAKADRSRGDKLKKQQELKAQGSAAQAN